MIEITEEETQALGEAIRRVGRVMETFGWETRLCDLTRNQMHCLVAETIEAFREEMAAIAGTQSSEIPF